ncbi:LysM peptidoglycan-binding domain-containing protein [Peribacillus sp. SCS-155]|uniref:LysM peptidoglycan-binding domain-containing protein n=1 Tax=Peribacillus sedimenti TaxID=3115297 RepID=UPI0039065FB4
MSNENESYLRFSLEESIWFQKGQEVAELYSLSLDPNVTIHERDQYVVIKGTLDLSGEYKEEPRSGESEPRDYTQSYLPKNIQHVERGADGVNVFMHRFPVDITIPYNRINSLYDVDVSIQTFDYVLPAKNCLKLQADLVITGIYKEPHAAAELGEEEEEKGEQKLDSEQVRDFAVEYLAEQEWEDDPPHRYEYNESLGEEISWLPPAFEGYDENGEQEEDEQPSELSLEEAMENLQQSERQNGIEAEEERTEVIFDKPIFIQKNTDDDLFTSFYAEAKKLPDEERLEEDEPLLAANTQPDIPVFNIPVAPLMDQLMKDSNYLASETSPAATYQGNQETVPVFEKVKQPKLEEEEAVEAAPAQPAEPPVQEVQPAAPAVPVDQAKSQNQQPAPAAAEQKESNVPAKGGAQKGFIKNKIAPILDMLPKGNRPPSEDKKRENQQQQENQEGKLSIMDYFGNKQEEQLTKVKVCIVQHGDTLDSLSDRYEVSAQSIVNSNELDPGSDVYEGQVLYIPKAPVFKK